MPTEPNAPAAAERDPGTGLTAEIATLPDGRRLRTVRAGTGPGPLVVFEAGMSAPAAEWIHTQREISEHARTLAYDRAGYAGSDVDPADRTLERIVEDLVGLLDTLGETEPAVFVGHSWGGPILRLFAEQHPERVAGLVLVDCTVAEVMSPRTARLQALMFRVMGVLARVGATPLIIRMSLPHGTSPEVTPADLEILIRDYASVSAMRAGGREAAQAAAALRTMRRLQENGTPDVPTISVQAGRVDRGAAKIRPIMNAVATDLMAAVPRGKVVVAEGAGHLVPQEAPGIVREAVLEVLDVARGRRAWS